MHLICMQPTQSRVAERCAHTRSACSQAQRVAKGCEHTWSACKRGMEATGSQRPGQVG